MYARILAPTDGSATAERGLLEAIALAATLKAHLVVLNVVDDFPVTVELATAEGYEQTRQALVASGRRCLAKAAKAAEEAGVAAETVLREVQGALIADTIVEEAAARRCELIVMGTHGRRGMRRLALGSDAEEVVRQAGVPVMLVRGT